MRIYNIYGAISFCRVRVELLKCKYISWNLWGISKGYPRHMLYNITRGKILQISIRVVGSSELIHRNTYASLPLAVAMVERVCQSNKEFVSRILIWNSFKIWCMHPCAALYVTIHDLFIRRILNPHPRLFQFFKLEIKFRSEQPVHISLYPKDQRNVCLKVSSINNNKTNRCCCAPDKSF